MQTAIAARLERGVCLFLSVLPAFLRSLCTPKILSDNLSEFRLQQMTSLMTLDNTSMCKLERSPIPVYTKDHPFTTSGTMKRNDDYLQSSKND
jgi:hypothetical protein